ncbi:glutaminase [Longispora fulva]|uniref:Glutaminase n=1 Tax=Longispora fulva TaxID=619741 RepID=A0A8J7GJ85_9ACTN|nr:glutaminase [Longispora fulva]MBG6137767.1 glutaminase [Longispora fulva]
MEYPQILGQVREQVADVVGGGRVADYIPALAAVDPGQFGMAVATVDGAVYGTGDWRVPLSVQSVTKVFSLALVLHADGEAIWRRVSREPSGNPFNSLLQLEQDRGIPRNPFINAGALVVTDRLLTLTGDARGAVRDFLRAEGGRPGGEPGGLAGVGPSIDFDLKVAESEAEHGHRNAALAHLLASYGNLENPVADVLEHYTWQCSLVMTCEELALAGRFLARHGTAADGSRLLSRSDAKRLNATMLTCGTYDSAGEVAYRVGLPAKSGVGGAILAVVPNRCAIAVWGPGLDESGNSVAGLAALDAFTTLTGWSVF